MASTAGRRLNQFTLINDGDVTGDLFLVGYDPNIAADTPSGIRFTAASVATYLSAASAVASVFGRTGVVVANADDYTNLNNLTIASSFYLTCEDDSTVHQVKLRKIGSEYMLEVVQ